MGDLRTHRGDPGPRPATHELIDFCGERFTRRIKPVIVDSDSRQWLAETQDLASFQDASCWAPIPRVKTLG